MGEKRKKLIAGLILSVVLTLAYLPVLNAVFLLDDNDELAHVGNMQSISAVWGADCYGFFRPAKNLLYYFVTRAAGRNRTAARVISLGLLLLAANMISYYLRRLGLDFRTAYASTALWALAPTLVSSVAWFSCANILLMTGMGVGALLSWENFSYSTGGRAAAWLAVAGILYVAAMTAYEAAIVVPALIIIREFLIVRRTGRVPRRALALALLLALGLGYFVLLRWHVSSTVVGILSIAPAPPAMMSFSAALLMIYHLGLWLWPFGRLTILSTFDPQAPGMMPAAAAAWILVTAIFVMLWRLRRRIPFVVFGILFFFIAILPLSNLVPLYNGPMADYYLSFASIGLAVAVGWMLMTGFRRLRERGVKAERWWSLVVVILIAWRAAAALYVPLWAAAWSSERRLLQAAVVNAPWNNAARAELARVIVGEKGQLSTALHLAQQSVEGAPWCPRGYYSLADVFSRMGRYAEARRVLDRLIQKYPDLTTAYVLEGALYDRSGQTASAERCYRKALDLRWHPQYSPIAAINLGGLLYQQGKTNEALEVWRSAAARDPYSLELQANLAFLYTQLGETELAARHLDRARRLGYSGDAFRR